MVTEVAGSPRQEWGLLMASTRSPTHSNTRSPVYTKAATRACRAKPRPGQALGRLPSPSHQLKAVTAFIPRTAGHPGAGTVDTPSDRYAPGSGGQNTLRPRPDRAHNPRLGSQG